ncbi:MAG: purine-nucleoside phosphorylase [Bacteroidales bacterium]|nr:purine-nucleoside phosphorylase [Bacteroidales bacterium]
MLEKINESASFLKSKITVNPKIAIVLGSGLGDLAKSVEVTEEISYKDIPNFPVSTVAGHKGSLMFGRLNGVEVVVMNGRFHYYEGYHMNDVVFPVRVFNALGIKKLILSNAAGGMNPTFQIGDIMVIRDHINLFCNNPLIGKNYDELGPRFVSMNDAYSKDFIKIAFDVAKKNNIYLQKGVYIGVSGPCYETPAEYRAFNILGADAVGMSTVPEVIAARHMGMEVFALSVITDLGVVGIVEVASHEAVLKAAAEAGPRMVKLVSDMVPLM